MSHHAMPPVSVSPVRYGSRYGSDPRCLVCMTGLPSRRARYCSDACKQRAYRRRQVDVTATDADLLAVELRRLGDLVAHTIYELLIRCEKGPRFSSETGPRRRRQRVSSQSMGFRSSGVASLSLRR